MAVVNSSTFNFQEVVNKFITSYSADVYQEMNRAIDDVSKEALKKLRAKSRSEFKSEKHEYAKGWAREVDKGRIRGAATIYGKKPTYMLAHLLENGHVTRNGSNRTFRDTPAHPHIQEVADWVVDEAIDRAIEYLEGI